MANPNDQNNPQHNFLDLLPDQVQDFLQQLADEEIFVLPDLADVNDMHIPGYPPYIQIHQGGPNIQDLAHYPDLYAWADEEAIRALAGDDEPPNLNFGAVPGPPQPEPPQTIDTVIIDNSHLIGSFRNEIQEVYRYINESVYFSFYPAGPRDRINYDDRPILAAHTATGLTFLYGEPQIHEELTYWVLSGQVLTPEALRAIARNILQQCGYNLECHGCHVLVNNFRALMDHVSMHVG